ncbi:MAG: tRNA (N(6)-L-threonylcarbamoyladenosine(37)-C(2))-methylthiotransferase MtaB [Bacteroidota bacterium]
MRVSLTTLGCKANQYDTEAIAEQFRTHGHTIVPFPSPAEVYIINTCSVTQEAVRKSRQLARRIHRANPGAIIALTGCYAQTGAEEAGNLPGVALVVGPQDRARMVELVMAAAQRGGTSRVVRPPGSEPGFIDLPVTAFGERTRAWLKIEDGCEEFCAYCQIPYARGPVRSLPPQRVLEEAARLVEAGYHELVLTGIHLGAYGRDLKTEATLADIIASLNDLPARFRLRLGSLEPNDVTPALIAALAASRSFCRHLHIPLQSGDDAILASMRRPYRTAEYAALLASLRESLPGLAVSTDLIVGFPGETEERFVSSLSFVERAGFSRLHVFPFSARPQTAAASFPGQLPRSVRQARSRAAVAAGERIALRFNRSLLQRDLTVLVENWEDGACTGLCEQYVEVRFPSSIDLRNEVVTVVGQSAAAGYIAAIPKV